MDVTVTITQQEADKILDLFTGTPLGNKVFNAMQEAWKRQKARMEEDARS